jgi:hypothetical protein
MPKKTRKTPKIITSRKLRRRRGYTVEAAGRKLGWCRTESYKAARDGRMPAAREGRFWIVPRAPWDRIVAQTLGRDVAARSGGVADQPSA